MANIIDGTCTRKGTAAGEAMIHCLEKTKAAADTTCPASKIELVEEQTGNTDPKANFRLIIIQTELERFKFLVRSFLRARIAKVCSPLEVTYQSCVP